MLTRRGAGVLLASLFLYMAGVLLGYEELLVLAVGALVPVLLGLVWVLRRPALEVHREVEPDRVTRGDPALGLLHLHNHARWSSAPVLAMEPCGLRRIPIDVPRLAAGATTTSTYRLPTERRSSYEVGPVQLTRGDPLGFWQTVKQTGGIRRVWVHPVAHPLRGLPSGRTRSLDGGNSDQVPHGSITFHALREYVVGDDLRLVHWRSYARTGTLMVRENVDTSLPQITVVVDLRAAVYTETSFEEAMEACASVLVAASRSGYPVRLITTSGRAVGGRGISADARSLLDVLAEIEITPDGDLRSLVASLATERRSDTLIAVTGAPSSEDLTLLGALARRYDDAVVISIGDQTSAIPAGMTASVVRAESGEEAARRWNQLVAAR